MANFPYPVILLWYSDSDPRIAPGVAAPLNQLCIRTDIPSIFYKSGAADTAWTLIGTGAASATTITRVLYVATGAEGSDFNVPIGVVLPNDNYTVMWAPGGVSMIPVVDIPDILAGDRTTSQFRVVTSANLTAGDLLEFLIAQ